MVPRGFRRLLTSNLGTVIVGRDDAPICVGRDDGGHQETAVPADLLRFTTGVPSKNWIA